MDPVAIHLLVVIFGVGTLMATVAIWRRRREARRAGAGSVRLTPLGNALLVMFVALLGAAVVLRQFYPETWLGAWLRTEGTMTSVVVGCLAVLFIAEALFKWLGRPTAEAPSNTPDA